MNIGFVSFIFTLLFSLLDSIKRGNAIVYHYFFFFDELEKNIFTNICLAQGVRQENPPALITLTSWLSGLHILHVKGHSPTFPRCA